MTSVIAWIAVDQRAPSALYLASDSRFTWSQTDSDGKKTIQRKWEYGRKLFASRKYPDIFGYYGDVLFPTQVLSQLTDLIDSDLLFETSDSYKSKLSKIMSFLRKVSHGYPLDIKTSSSILYCTRQDKDQTTSLSSTFHIAKISWLANNDWDIKWLHIPEKSGFIDIFGTGQNYIREWAERWAGSAQGGTSRSIFSAFCDALEDEQKKDPFSGGAPQLVGIHRKGTGKYFGVIYQNNRYFLGLPVEKSPNPNHISWFNDLLEISDGKTKKRKKEAQKHQDILGIGDDKTFTLK